MKFENTVLNECGRAVYRFSLALTKNEDDARDVTQSAFLLLFEKKPKFNDTRALRVWLIRCAKNIIYNEHKRPKTVSLEQVSEIAVKDELSFELCDLFSVLSPDSSQVIELYYIEDMTTKEIAKALSKPHGTVRSTLSRARAQLKKIYKEEIL